MSPFLIRELNTEILFVMDIGLLCFIVYYLYSQIKLMGVKYAFMRMGNQAALVIGIHVLGLTIQRSWSMVMYWMRFNAIGYMLMEETYQVVLVGLAITAIGLAGTVRIFSPPSWGNYGWMTVFAAAAIFAAALHIRLW